MGIRNEESLFWVKNKDGTASFNPATDSLEAIRDYLSTLLGGEGDEWGNIYFIDPATGTDLAATDGSRTNPFATVTYALTRCIPNNNDLIWCLPGAYNENAAVTGITVNVGGVHIKAVIPSLAIFENSNVGATRIFNVTANYIEFCGLAFDEDTNTVDAFVFAGALSNHIHVHECFFSGTHRYSIDTGGADDNNIYDNIFRNGVTGVRLRSARNIIVNNYFHDYQDNGIDFQNGAVNNIVRNNVIDGNDGATDNGIGAMNCSLNSVTNNAIFGCNDGIHLSVTATDFQVANNAITNCIVRFRNEGGNEPFNQTPTEEVYKEALAAAGIEALGPGEIFFVDNVNGNDGFDGHTPESAVASVEQAYALSVDARGDLIAVINRGADYDLDAAAIGLTIVKNFISIVGINYPHFVNSNGAATDIFLLDQVSHCTITGLFFTEDTPGVSDIRIVGAAPFTIALLNKITGNKHATMGGRGGIFVTVDALSAGTIIEDNLILTMTVPINIMVNSFYTFVQDNDIFDFDTVGILTAGANDIIKNNTLNGGNNAGVIGIHNNGADDTTISGNTVLNCTTAGIHITNASARVQSSDNKVIGCGVQYINEDVSAGLVDCVPKEDIYKEALAAAGISAMGAGVSFFVDNVNGNNNNDGLTPERAFATPEQAVALAVASRNDNIFVMNRGTTYDVNAAVAGLTINKIGLRIIGIGLPEFENTNGGATQVFYINSVNNIEIKGIKIIETTNTVVGIEFNVSSNCHIHHNKLIGSMEDGIVVSNGSTFNVFEKNHLEGIITNGFDISGDDNTIENNKIISVGGQGIILEASANSNVIKDNTIEGDDLDTTNGILINAADYNTIVKNNISECAAGIYVINGSVSNSLIKNAVTGCTNNYVVLDATTNIVDEDEPSYSGTYVIANGSGAAELVVDTFTPLTNGKVGIRVDCNAPAVGEGGVFAITVRLYEMIDGATFRLVDEQTWTTGTTTIHPTVEAYCYSVEALNHMELRIVCSANVTADRNLPWRRDYIK